MRVPQRYDSHRKIDYLGLNVVSENCLLSGMDDPPEDRGVRSVIIFPPGQRVLTDIISMGILFSTVALLEDQPSLSPFRRGHTLDMTPLI